MSTQPFTVSHNEGMLMAVVTCRVVIEEFKNSNGTLLEMRISRLYIVFSISQSNLLLKSITDTLKII